MDETKGAPRRTCRGACANDRLASHAGVLIVERSGACGLRRARWRECRQSVGNLQDRSSASRDFRQGVRITAASSTLWAGERDQGQAFLSSRERSKQDGICRSSSDSRARVRTLQDCAPEIPARSTCRRLFSREHADGAAGYDVNKHEVFVRLSYDNANEIGPSRASRIFAIS